VRKAAKLIPDRVVENGIIAKELSHSISAQYNKSKRSINA